MRWSSTRQKINDERRIEMEAHLEGLAYTGTAAAEKTLRSIDPDEMRDQMPIQRMLTVVKTDACLPEERAFGSDFEAWWFAEAQIVWLARELRNDAAHRVHEKAPNEQLWRLDVAGRRIGIAEFAEREELTWRHFVPRNHDRDVWHSRHLVDVW